MNAAAGRAGAALALALLLAACSAGQNYRDPDAPLLAFGGFELDRYMGRWYEIARIPNRFERNCAGVVHDYALNPDGRVAVRIICRVATLAGPVETFDGRARVLDPPEEWKISFNPWVPWFFDGDYVVLSVDPDYQVAVVGDPEGQIGWILGRDHVLADDSLRAAYEVLDRNGYDLSEIILVDQPPVGD